MPSSSGGRIIRISETNYHRLRNFAEPLTDTRNDTMTRVLDMAESWREHLLSGQTSQDPPQSRPDEGDAAQ